VTLQLLHQIAQRIVLYAEGMTEIAVRKTVPLTGPEAGLVERARSHGTRDHRALVRLVGAEVGGSEAATLHALLRFALAALAEQIALDDYAQLAASRDAEDEDYERAMRRRVRGR
jgi:hypothetical protein